MHLFSLTAYQFQKRVGDKPKRDSLCDAEGEGHHQERQECRDGLCHVVPIDVDNVFEHQAPNDNQRGSDDRIEERIFANLAPRPDHLDEWVEEQREQHQCRRHHVG